VSGIAEVRGMYSRLSAGGKCGRRKSNVATGREGEEDKVKSGGESG
jgi:hypothetical protein